jgi:putative PIN family toxin of toxin-antitoxin system
MGWRLGVVIRAVLDTNTIVSVSGWGGAPGAMLDAALAGQYDLVTSTALLDELRRVLTYPKLQAVIGQTSELIELIALASIVGRAHRDRRHRPRHRRQPSHRSCTGRRRRRHRERRPGSTHHLGHRGSGFGPVAVTSRCGTQSSTWLKPSNVAP